MSTCEKHYNYHSWTVDPKYDGLFRLDSLTTGRRQQIWYEIVGGLCDLMIIVSNLWVLLPTYAWYEIVGWDS